MVPRWLVLSPLIGLLALAAACASDDGGDDGGDGGAADEAAAATGAQANDGAADDQAQAEDQAAISADDLKFDLREIQSLDALGNVEWQVTIGVPADWVAQQPDDFPGLFRPPDAFLVPQLWIGGGSCSGSCGARTVAEWPAQLDSGDWSQYLDEERFNVRRAENLPGGGRLLEVDNRSGRVTFLVAMFQENTEHYFSCLYQTEQDDDPLLPLIEASCLAASIDELN